MQLTFDVLNLINLVNHNAGLLRYVANQTYTALNYSGIDAATGKPIYTVNSGALNEGRPVHDPGPPLALPAQARRTRLVLANS